MSTLDVPRHQATAAEFEAEYADRDPLHIDVKALSFDEYLQHASNIIQAGNKKAQGRDLVAVVLITDVDPPVMAFTWARPALFH